MANSNIGDEVGQMLNAIGTAFALIEFAIDGTILNANSLFLKVVGYDLEEIQNKHHSMFVDATARRSPDYKAFWHALASGQAQTGEFKRISKSGDAIFIQASYVPVKDERGVVYKVVKLALDRTAEYNKSLSVNAQIDAINKSQAVIEFKMDGTIVDANDNFLKAVGYSRAEIIGQHHRMFCDSIYVSSPEYREFWNKLNRGEFQTGEYRRIGKGGKEIWLQASYNPILGIDGRPVRVVKFASDISMQKLKDAELEALSRTQAVIEFSLDGNILKANKNFLDALGYRMDEIKGKHHAMFCEHSYTSSPEYKNFWAKLNRGEFDSGVYKRLTKSGKPIWIQASYNPVLDLNGHVLKIVKYATDVTKQTTERINLINNIGEASRQLAAASEELSATSTEMSENAAKTTATANATAASSEEVTQGVRTVATNTEEMTLSIKEIARNASEASITSTTTLKQAQATNSTIMKLGESSQEIGNVIKVISSIAQQTNLLALNATIEAARAGDAGRGFAVVANEVKELAKQTAKATEEITNKITGIQKDSQGAVEAVAAIGVTIEKLNGIAGAIAASVEEQAATTNEVSRVVQESARGVQEISDNVRHVSSAAEQTSVGSTQVLTAAKSLSELAARLETLVRSIEV